MDSTNYGSKTVIWIHVCRGWLYGTHLPTPLCIYKELAHGQMLVSAGRSGTNPPGDDNGWLLLSFGGI